MKIIVLSDTHMPKMAKQFPQVLLNEVKNCDLILHAGDWQTPEVVYELRQYADVQGVYGNTDGYEIRSMFEKTYYTEIHGVKIGITHGDGTSKTTEERAIEMFEYENLDLLIYGHSHIPVYKEQGTLTIFNPGSPTDKRRQSHYSFGILEIGDDWSIRHVFFDNKH